MSICPGCGGVIGRDCFNTVECQQIAASMNNQAEYENEQLKNELQRLQAACIQKDEAIAALRVALGRCKRLCNEDMSKSERLQLIFETATEALKQ